MNGNGIISKIARLAASKAAAFTYAVAVGVAGNLAFNFVQQHHTAPPSADAPIAAPARTASPEPPTREESERQPRRAVREPVHASLRPEKVRAPARHSEADAQALPEPPATIALPSLDSLRAPVLKPAVLPFTVPLPSKPAGVVPAPEAALPPAPSAPGRATGSAMNDHLAPVPGPPAPAASAALPPLGNPIDVAPPPEPPAESDQAARAPDPVSGSPSDPAEVGAAPPDRSPTAMGPFAAVNPDGSAAGSWRLSDIWHPGRAMVKGLHWAGDQLPTFGGDDSPRTAHAAVLARPIPLLPPPAGRVRPDRASAPPPGSGQPGPGSGGLY